MRVGLTTTAIFDDLSGYYGFSLVATATGRVFETP